MFKGKLKISKRTKRRYILAHKYTQEECRSAEIKEYTTIATALNIQGKLKYIRLGLHALVH